MPYIKEPLRKILDEHLDYLHPRTAGELNYCLTKLFIDYVKSHGGVSYQNFNDIIGAIECSKAELYRRQIVDFENKKIKVNGDVY